MRNNARLAKRQQMMNCRGSTAFPVRTDGQELIEIDGKQAARRTASPRMLVRLRGNRVETVCRMEQRVIYVPKAEPINKAP
jgi:hypothetical protein